MALPSGFVRCENDWPPWVGRSDWGGGVPPERVWLPRYQQSDVYTGEETNRSDC